VTADAGYVPAIDSNAGGAWRIILLPDDSESQGRALLRIAGEKLTFTPTKESTDIIEFASQNRILLDIRRDPPF
jgi:hypothetical protein